MNPYMVLGIPTDANEEEVRAAYIGLVKAFHPDRFVGREIEGEMQERLKEINLAYDQLFGSFGGHGSGGERRAADGYVEGLIRDGQLERALEMLHCMSDRDAEWYYLEGLLRFRMGEIEGAVKRFEEAVGIFGMRKYETALAQANAVLVKQRKHRWKKLIKAKK